MDFKELAFELLVTMKNTFKMPIHEKIGGISQGEMRLLGHIMFRGVGVTAGELSEQLGFTTPRVASALNSLSKKGYIERSRNPEDKRMVIVQVTDEGKDFLIKRRQEVVGMTEQMLEKLGENDAKELIRILKRINEITNQD